MFAGVNRHGVANHLTLLHGANPILGVTGQNRIVGRAEALRQHVRVGAVSAQTQATANTIVAAGAGEIAAVVAGRLQALHLAAADSRANRPVATRRTGEPHPAVV